MQCLHWYKSTRNLLIWYTTHDFAWTSLNKHLIEQWKLNTCFWHFSFHDLLMWHKDKKRQKRKHKRWICCKYYLKAINLSLQQLSMLPFYNCISVITTVYMLYTKGFDFCYRVFFIQDLGAMGLVATTLGMGVGHPPC